MSRVVRPAALLSTLFAGLLACAAQNAVATTYYVDPAGNNANNGTSTTTPWATVSYAAGRSLQPGDQVLLKCDGVWDLADSLTVTKTGTEALPIEFGAYGGCVSAKPEIRFSKAVTSWTLHQGNIWKATVTTDQDIQQVIVAGRVLTPARYPKVTTSNIPTPTVAPTNQMLRIESGDACGALNSAAPDLSCGLVMKSAELGALPSQDLVGADIIVRDSTFGFDRRRIGAYDAGSRKVSWKTTTTNSSGTIIDSPSRYALLKDQGYFFTNKLWMLTEPGEWVVEQGSGTTRTLYVRMPDDSQPPSVSSAANVVRVTPRKTIGLRASGSSYVTFRGLRFSDASTAFHAVGSTTVGVKLLDSEINRSGNKAIEVSGAVGSTLSGNQIRDSAFFAIYAAGNGVTTDLVVDGNRILFTGTHVPPTGSTESNESFASVYCLECENGSVRNNFVYASSYIGLRVHQHGTLTAARSEVVDNTVVNSCFYLDDCGAIYTFGRNGLDGRLSIAGNIVRNSFGSLIGRPLNSNGTDQSSSAQGIFLDDLSKAVEVRDNVVINTDNGAQMHLARNSEISDNLFYASRKNSLWFQEDRTDVLCSPTTSCVVGNVSEGNTLFPGEGAYAVYRYSAVGDTDDMGSFDTNRYLTPFRLDPVRNTYRNTGVSPAVTVEQTSTVPAWQATGQETNGGTTLDFFLAPLGYTVPSPRPDCVAAGNCNNGYGANLVLNPDFTNGKTSWSSYSDTGNHNVTVYPETNPAGMYYARLTAATDAPTNILYTLAMQVEPGYDYVISYSVRDPGGTGYTFEPRIRAPAGNREAMRFSVPVTGQWSNVHHYAALTSALFAERDFPPAVGGLVGIRFDFQIPISQALDVTNVRLQKIPANVARKDSGAWRLYVGDEPQLDAGPTALSYACPDAGGPQAARCDSYYVDGETGQTVSWPLSVGSRKGRVVIARDPRFVDTDGDGVIDTVDQCPGTALGLSADLAGCAWPQLHP